MKFHIFPPTDGLQTERCLLIFAGWSMDEKPFARLSKPGYSIAVVWDYRDSSFPPDLLERLGHYREIAVIGWSFGIPAATRLLHDHCSLPFSARIAINGTMHPVDDRLGIPTAIFRGTLDGLNEKTLSKFHLRMAGSADSYCNFARSLPIRRVDELIDELKAIERNGEVSGAVWDIAVVSNSDRIFPPENQLRAWSEIQDPTDERAPAIRTVCIEGPHLPDFQRLIDGLITEKGLVAEKFSRAGETYDENAVIQRQIAEKLCDLARASADETPRTILEIGCGTGTATRMLATSFQGAPILAWDLHIPDRFPKFGPQIRTVECDAETEIRSLPDGSFDMIFSASTVQWFNSLPEFLRQVRRVLRPGGTAFISTFGPDTMKEIRRFMPGQPLYHDIGSLRRMIPDGLTLTELEEERHIMRFASPLEVMRHVKLTGVNAIARGRSDAIAREVIRNYPLDADRRAPITYQPIYISLKKDR